MKIIAYSLFSHPSAREFERRAYIRGLYWNFRMNTMIYPEWKTHLEIDRSTYTEFQELFDWLAVRGMGLSVNDYSPELCEGMLWRMKPVFFQDVSHVLCRDADALTTYREAQRVQDWLERGQAVHSILDNPAHGGLMGGMIGFVTARLKDATSWNSYNNVVAGIDLKARGSDQHLLNQRILPHLKTETHTHGMAELTIRIPNVDAKLWESNLCVRHIGSAGVVEMETIRFFKRFDAYDYAFEEMEKQFPKLFYWHS